MNDEIDRSRIEWGTAGWVDDGGEYIDGGDASNDGNDFVRVTLFRGRGPVDPLDQTQAQGAPLVCSIADGVAMPSRGDKVLVAIPEGYGKISGGPCIIAVRSNNYRAKGNAAGGEKIDRLPGSAVRVGMRADGSWTVATTDTNKAGGNAIFFTIGPKGLRFVAPWGTFVFDPTGFRVRTAAGAWIAAGGINGLPAPFSALSSYVKIHGAIVKVDGTQVLLGPDTPATVYGPAVYGLPTDTPPQPVLMNGLESTSVKVAS